MDNASEPLIRRFDVKRISQDQSERIVDSVAAEEPLGIRITYWVKESQRTESLAVTMRTPGHDQELAAGFLLSEGIVVKCDDILAIRSLGVKPSNEIAVELASSVDVDTWRMRRNNFVGASCGICGKRSREALTRELPEYSIDELRITPEVVERLPAALIASQSGFAQTGGLHAAALANESGEIEQMFEDIGRHNALDKLLGWCLLQGRIPLSRNILFLSSRSSFELVQKALMAGAPVLAAIGGTSSLAIETAREHGITLLGFVRSGRMNVYSGDWRLHSN
ncbi:MAG TPA: formate dehydrogenase accessory sulfurtransferase FdhD [Bryobacteraceae bacterium]|nr:formate dehydrogenase accessory sulfurtransferase FdhD [Bryobacteraceae bacterium]